MQFIRLHIRDLVSGSVQFFTGYGSVWVLTHFLLSGLCLVQFLSKPRFWFGFFLVDLGSFAIVLKSVLPLNEIVCTFTHFTVNEAFHFT